MLKFHYFQSLRKKRRPRSGKTAKLKVNEEEEVMEEDDSMRSESQDDGSDSDDEQPLPVKARRFGCSSTSFNGQSIQDVDNGTENLLAL